MSEALKITPKGEITWQAHDLPTGRLYVPPTHKETLDPMNIFDAVDENRNRHKRLGMGMEGVVYDIAGYAVKAFINPATLDTTSALRANVALSEGLMRIAQPQNSSFEIAGAEIYAAFIPHEEHEEDIGYRAIWLMEKISPPMKIATYLHKRKRLFGEKLNDKRPLPTRSQRLATYTLALEKYGLKISDIVIDEADFLDLNLMISKLPAERQRGKLVKIDERPVGGKSSFNSY